MQFDFNNAVVKLSKDGSRLTQIVSEIKGEFISTPRVNRESGKGKEGEIEKRTKVGRQRSEREALVEGAFNCSPAALAIRSPGMPEIEQSPSRFLLPHTSSIHPSPLPRPTSSTFLPLSRIPPESESLSFCPRPRRMKALAANRRNLAGIDNHGDGAVPVGFSPPKLTASFARKHPRLVAPLFSRSPECGLWQREYARRRNNSMRFYPNEYH